MIQQPLTGFDFYVVNTPGRYTQILSTVHFILE